MSANPVPIRSVIHEYNILYTSRVRQKTKNWIDGKLTFYEFNQKVEIHNENNLLVATDFYKNRTVNDLLNNLLKEDQEFKLPNCGYLIQMLEKIGVFEREVNLRVKNEDSQDSQKSKRPGSLGAKRRATQDPELIAKISYTSSTPQQSISRVHNVPQVKRVLSSVPSKPKTIGAKSIKDILSGTVKTNVKVTKPKNVTVPKPKTNPQLPQQSTPKTKPTLPKITQTKPARVSKSFLEQIDTRVSTRLPIRILPRSSNHYQYLFTPSDNLEIKPLPEKSALPIDLEFDDDDEHEYTVEHSQSQLKEGDDLNELSYEVEDFEEEFLDDDEQPEEELDQNDLEEELAYERERQQEGEEEDMDYNPSDDDEDDDESSSYLEPSQMKRLERLEKSKSNSTPELSDSEIESEIKKVKKEPHAFTISSTRPEDADIVYDLSDYERNVRFNELLRKSREQNQALNDVTNKFKKSKRVYNEAAEFNLSTDSEMEEI
ncbi:hypothetical protein G210_2492 [Candida maltosa Xu316]|uniref:5'-3' DNA helicase ZGRF1-like N-terminal domain-containing protein n=1 Tax=Candida maltosa (strain Xu316) TaxID=1245528 RepID=M3JXR5_CANMX|nr:hypothetical protein G210_2492 [Candida maltosa Xu316]